MLKRLDPGEVRDSLQPRLRLFMSADIVGSTAFKQRSSRDSDSWFGVVRSFYSKSQGFFDKKWDEAYKAHLDSASVLHVNAEPPSLWKTIGDEVLFTKEICHPQEALLCMSAWMGVLGELRSMLTKSKSLDLKSSAWLADFPIRNREIFLLTPGHRTAPDAPGQLEAARRAQAIARTAPALQPDAADSVANAQAAVEVSEAVVHQAVPEPAAAEQPAVAQVDAGALPVVAQPDVAEQAAEAQQGHLADEQTPDPVETDSDWENAQLFDLFCKGAPSVSRDFIGQSIDTGFRVSGEATARKLTLSVELAHMLSKVCSDLIADPHQIPTLDPRDFKFYFDGRQPLKGVLGGIPYPVIWLDTEPRRAIYRAEDALMDRPEPQPSLVHAFTTALISEFPNRFCTMLPFFGSKPPKYEQQELLVHRTIRRMEGAFKERDRFMREVAASNNTTDVGPTTREPTDVDSLLEPTLAAAQADTATNTSAN